MSTAASETFGRRLARLRSAHRLTQQEVAARLAISRNAVSHMETGLTYPSERTVVLLAGLFRLEPHELVTGTDYPPAKADRLPLVAPRYTEVEARLHRLDTELALIAQLPDVAAVLAVASLVEELVALERASIDPSERAQLAASIVYVGEVAARNRA